MNLNELDFINKDNDVQKNKVTNVQSYKGTNDRIRKGFSLRKDQIKNIKLIKINTDKNEYEIALEAFDDLIKKKKKQGII